jgi:RNA polymerase sigma-70 factor, ECF subfamily
MVSNNGSGDDRPAGRGVDRATVAAARVGDAAAFTALVERYRRELQVHCYRMVGSIEDSEDLVQETFLRAWRKRASFRLEGRWSFRRWLYRIATNACLDLLAQRPRRVLPHDVAPPADPTAQPPPPADLAWLEPYPDVLLDTIPSDDPDPHTVVVARETIELAFVAAIHHLPARQRAVLLLRDVLGWSAKDTASLLQTTVPAANSALQRARATLRKRLPARRAEWPRPTDVSREERELLQRYMDAQERGDADAVLELLHEDARVSFPPLPLWYDGRDAFGTASERFAAPGDYRFVATSANTQPATAIYLRRPDDTEYRPLVIEVLRIEDGLVAEIVDFGALELFAAFGLPPTLDVVD